MGIHDRFFIEKRLTELLQREKKKFKGTENQFQKWSKVETLEILTGLNSTLRKTVFKFSAEEIKRKVQSHKRLTSKIEKRYVLPLSYFEVFLELNLQIGRDTYRKYYEVFDSFEDHLKLDTLIEIHARACQVAAEINLLVKNGFADGAHGRWRSLHELCIVFLFLYDNDHDVIKMYHEYSSIEMWDKLKKFNDSNPRLGWRPISVKEFDSLTKERDRLIMKYGKDFARGYGWTIKVLPPGKRTIRGIEEFVQKDHLRGIYSWASENVHAGISGNKKRLGMPEGKAIYFLTGPTEHGLMDPIQFTSYSLMEMSDTLLNMEETILNQLYSQLLVDSHYMTVKEFDKIDKRLNKGNKKKLALRRSKKKTISPPSQR